MNCAMVASPDTVEDAFYLEMQKGALDGVKIQTGGSECATQRKVERKHWCRIYSFKNKTFVFKRKIIADLVFDISYTNLEF